MCFVRSVILEKSSLNEVYQYYISDVVSSPGFDKLTDN